MGAAFNNPLSPMEEIGAGSLLPQGQTVPLRRCTAVRDDLWHVDPRPGIFEPDDPSPTDMAPAVSLPWQHQSDAPCFFGVVFWHS